MRDESYVTLAGVVSAGLGLLTDVLLVRLLNNSAETDAVFVAGTLPLLIQSLMIAAYQPVVVVHLIQQPALASVLSRQVKRLAFLLTCLAVLTTPLITLLSAPGLRLFGSAMVLNAIVSFTIFLLIMGEHGRTLLHVERRFIAAATLLLVANLAGVISIFSVVQVGIWGFALSRICRALVLWAGVRWLLRNSNKNTPENISTWHLWQNIFSAGVGYGSLQIPWLVMRSIASFSGSGVITAIDVAWRLLSQVTYLIVLVPVTVQLPVIAHAPSRQQIHTLLKVTCILALLCTLGTMIFALPVVILLYGLENAPLMAQTLLIMSASVTGLSLLRFVQYLSFARKQSTSVHQLALWIIGFSLLFSWAGAAGIGITLNLAALVGLYPELKKASNHPDAQGKSAYHE